ncbi:MAG: hypothetical protein KAI43_02515 [Candidatus Aureabacteria bacterium]|nr:hypothetical protein [Candidatus Auribacterota bacterium]
MSFLYVILLLLVFSIIFLLIYRSLAEICNIYDKAFQVIKSDIVGQITPYLLFSSPFWIGIFYFFSKISRFSSSSHEQFLFISIMACVLSGALYLSMAGKVILTAVTALNIMGQKAQGQGIMPIIKGKVLDGIAVCSLFFSLGFITIYFIIPPVLFYICAGLSIPIILLEEEKTTKPVRETFSTLFRNLFFLIRLSLAGFLIMALLFINIVTGLYFIVGVLGFFHIIDSHSFALKLSSPRFIFFCSIITLMFFDFFWTIVHTVYFFHHSANRSGKDLIIKLENLTENEKQI